MMNYKRMMMAGILGLSLCGCAKTQESQTITELPEVIYEEDDYFQDYDHAIMIDLNEQKDELAITNAGTYVLSGTLNGTITISLKETETARLVLNNVEIQAQDRAAIICNQAKKLILSLPDDTINTIADAKTYAENEESAAAIFVQDNLTINGTGTLRIHGNKKDGILSKDTLKLMGGTYEVDAASDAIIGRDYLYVHDGVYTISALQDGLKTTYDKDDTKGDLIIENGNLNITAENDGIQSERKITIYDGTIQILSGGGSVNASTAANANQPGGFGRWSTTTKSETPSAKGIKSNSDMILNGGTFLLDCSDDCIHANANIEVNGGTYELSSGDDGIHADDCLTITGGIIDVQTSYEGLEGSDVLIQAGDITIVSQDDGINAAGGSDTENNQPFPDHFNGGDHQLKILGGTMQINANGDGIDSNGDILMEAGTLVIFGPSDNGNSAIDYERSFTMNGGILVAAGSSGMAQGISETSSQNAIMFHIDSQTADTLIYLSDTNGNLVCAVQPPKAYDNIVISSGELKDGETYALYLGGNATQANDAGLLIAGVSGGDIVEEVKVSQRMTVVGTSKGRPMDQGFDHPQPPMLNQDENEKMPPQDDKISM